MVIVTLPPVGTIKCRREGETLFLKLAHKNKLATVGRYCRSKIYPQLKFRARSRTALHLTSLESQTRIAGSLQQSADNVVRTNTLRDGGYKFRRLS
jgi:hypothetical protein